MPKEMVLKSHCLASEHNVGTNKSAAPMPKEDVLKSHCLPSEHSKQCRCEKRTFWNLIAYPQSAASKPTSKQCRCEKIIFKFHCLPSEHNVETTSKQRRCEKRMFSNLTACQQNTASNPVLMLCTGRCPWMKKTFAFCTDAVYWLVLMLGTHWHWCCVLVPAHELENILFWYWCCVLVGTGAAYSLALMLCTGRCPWIKKHPLMVLMLCIGWYWCWVLIGIDAVYWSLPTN